MPDDSGFGGAMEAGANSFQASVTGAAYGIQGLMAGGMIGSQRLISDLGSMMPQINAPRMHPMMQARHGMYAHEMSFTGDVRALFGMGIPSTTTAYEYQQLAASDLGTRVGEAVGFAGLYGAASLASFQAGTAAVGAGWRMGRNLAQGSRFARGLMAGGSIARAGGAAVGLAGGVVGAAAGMLPLMAIDEFVGAVAEDVGNRRDISNFLEASSFRYATGSGPDIDQRFGAGFNRKARSEIAHGIRNIDLSDASFNMDDLKGVLESGTQLGLFNGVRDAKDFGEKFKEITNTLKTITRTLHTSLAEGMKTIKDLKDQGYTTPQQMQQAIMTADVIGTASGRTASEMLSIGRQGSEMVRGTGISLATGSSMLQQTSGMVNMLYQSGAISSEILAQAGGADALSQRLMASGIEFTRSSFGRGAMMSITDSQGNVDLGRFNMLASGQQTLHGMAGDALSGLPTPASFINQVVNRNKNIREVSEQFGGMGLQFLSLGSRMSRAETIVSLSDGKVSMENALRFEMVNSGLSESEIETSMKMLKNADDFRSRQQGALRVQAEKGVGELIRRRTDISGRVGDWFGRTFVNPVSNLVGGAIESMEDSVESAYTGAVDTLQEKMFGIKKLRTTAISNKRADEILLGGFGVGIGGETEAEIKAKGNIFTEEDRKKFAKSEAYAELDKKFGANSVGFSAVSAGTLQAYSKAVIGKGWDSLSKQERMYVEDQAERTGMTKVKEEIDSRQLRSEQLLRDADLGKLEDALERRDKAKQDLSQIRGRAVRAMAGASGGEIFKKEVDELLEKDESAQSAFDKLVVSKGEVDKLETKIDRLKAAGSTPDETDVKKLSETRAKMRSLKGDIIGRLNKQGITGRAAARHFAKNFDSARLGGISHEMEDAVQVLDQTQGSAEYKDMRSQANLVLRNLGTGKLEGSLFGDSERSRFETGVEELQEIFNNKSAGGISNLSEFRKLAAKSGNRSLAGLLTQAEAIERKGTIKNFDEIRSTLNLDQSFTDKQIEKAFGEDGLDSKEFLRHQGVKEFSARAGGTRVRGGADTKELMEQEVDTVKDLVETQQRIADVANQLEALATRLERRGL